MAHPKTKTGGKGRRRSHHALKPLQFKKDDQGNIHLPHKASIFSGQYKGRTVVDIEKRQARHAKRVKKFA